MNVNKAMKYIYTVIIVSTVLISGALGILKSGVLDISLPDLRSKYQTVESKLVNLDGIEVHYYDEGEGPTVMISHASYHSLHSWDGVAELLKKSFRVVRFDYPNAGLSGLDSKNRYSVEHYQKMISQLADALSIEQFHLVGTSSGGTVAFRYAANNPERVDRLVLVNSAGMPRTKVTNPNRIRGNVFQRWLSQQYKSPSHWQHALSKTVTSKPPSQEHIEQTYDFNRRANRRSAAEIFRKNYVTGNPQIVFNKIIAPTLILWGMDNPTVMHLEANVIQHWMTSAYTMVKKYSKLGHYPYIEEPKLVAQDIIAFLSGEMDNKLLKTTLISKIKEQNTSHK
jgi:pimeloyl-ACP methyl ester carboxylesterase